jgi:hypothetical protein
MRLLALLLPLLAACTGPYPSDILRQPVVPDYPAAEHTYLLFDPAEGFRVEYLGTGGLAVLWAPQGGLVPGRWRLDDRHRIRNMGPVMQQAGEELCQYFGTRPEAALGRSDWDCRPRRRAADRVAAVLRGDPFGLATARMPPFPYTRCAPPAVFELRRDAGC